MTSDDPNRNFGTKGGRLTPAQREYAVSEIQNGKTQSAVAAELGVTRAAISLLWVTWNKHKSQGFTKLLTNEEQQRLKSEMLQSSPKDHGLARLGEEKGKFWTGLRAHAFAQQLFNRKLNKLPIMELAHLWRHDLHPRTADAPPQAPTLEIDEDDLEPEFRNDPDFMAYIRSPIARQIREREIENWRREQEDRQQRAKSTIPLPDDDREDIPALPPPLVRTGKHRGSKGSPFTKPKRKRKK